MRFSLTPEHREFAAALHSLLSDSDCPKAARSWAAGDHAPGLELWRRLADLGVTGLAIPSAHGGLSASPLDLVVAFEELGHHAVPGPLVESIAAAPVLLSSTSEGELWLPRLASGSAIATVAVGGYALDADIADLVLLSDGFRPSQISSVDPTRRLFAVEESSQVDCDLAVLATAAQLQGAGRALLEMTVDYVKQRVQFGRSIGTYQAVKHQLADLLIALEFSRPLLYAGALSMSAQDVSAAKIACGEAAAKAARTALQLHGAIGYTAEYDLSLWLTKVQALTRAWGTASEHRSRVMTCLSSTTSSGPR